MKQVKLFGSTEDPVVLTSLGYEKAQAVALQVKEVIKPLCDKLKIVGSIRRKKPQVGDCDFVVLATDSNWAKIVPTLRKSKVICSGPSLTKVNIPVEGGFFQVDFYRATPQTFGIQELIRTGSADHNMWLAGYALSKGYRLKYSTGLIKDGSPIAGETEESFFSALGLCCPEPQLREIVEGKPVWMPPEKLSALVWGIWQKNKFEGIYSKNRCFRFMMSL
jgi:DNA polymerase/3'-5' exonuclease PolX